MSALGVVGLVGGFILRGVVGTGRLEGESGRKDGGKGGPPAER